MITQMVLVTDFGTIALDDESAHNLARVPMRKNGRSEDCRYRISRQYAEWFKAAQSAAYHAYLRGDGISTVQVPIFQPAA